MPTGHYHWRRSFGNVGSLFRGARPDTYPLFSGVLDKYPGSTAAYSLRSLSSDWIGSDVIWARRTDLAERGFTSAEITDGTLATWSAGGDVFVVTWYDQSGNARDVTQPTSTNQPKVVSGGSLVTDANSNATVQFDGTDNLSGSHPSTSQPITVWTVHESPIFGTRFIYDLASSNDVVLRENSGGANIINAGVILAGPLKSTGVLYLNYNLFNGASSELALNGATPTIGDAGTNAADSITIGSQSGGSFDYVGNIGEFILFDSDKTSIRSDIEADIAANYGITLA